jgi:excinuclease ABC subunit C
LRCWINWDWQGGLPSPGSPRKIRKKKETTDKIYLPNRANPVNLGSDGRLLLLLQQIRDEAHRFAITFQRKQRTRATVRSVLDDISGVGPKRKAMLMKHFGSIKKIRAATVNELSELPGINPSMAEAITTITILRLPKSYRSGSMLQLF